MSLYHVTPAQNIDSILKDGLIPQIGARSALANDRCAIYLFKGRNSVDNAMMNWFCDEFDEDETFALFKINRNALDKGYAYSEVEWELAYTKTIPPAAITLISTDI